MRQTYRGSARRACHLDGVRLKNAAPAPFLREVRPTRGRIVLVDPDATTRASFADRLRSQDFVVDEAADGVIGAAMALAAPPAAVVADLWMEGVSGVQLCRLLKSEPTTREVPVVLRGDDGDPSSRFWAPRAGAEALVSKRGMRDLLRVLLEVVRPRAREPFIVVASDRTLDVRERIAHHLDLALFESVVAAEVRGLATAPSMKSLFDGLSVLAAQLLRYRWMSLVTTDPATFTVHTHVRNAERAAEEARARLGVPHEVPSTLVVDTDAGDEEEPGRTLRADVTFGGAVIGRLALDTAVVGARADVLVPLIARELGPAVRLATVLEESRRLATTDGLTTLLNRRAFTERFEESCSRDGGLSLLLLDLDHFKAINDAYGHAAGDLVLAAVGAALTRLARGTDIVARWGGEEFVVGLRGASLEHAAIVADRIRCAIADLVVLTPDAERIPITASIGVAARRPGERLEEILDRADRAMYAAKEAGRNRTHTEPFGARAA